MIKVMETRNPNPDRGPTSLQSKPEGSSLAGSKAASRARSDLEMQ